MNLARRTGHDSCRQDIARVLAGALRGDREVTVDLQRSTPLVAAACCHNVSGLLLEALEHFELTLPPAQRDELAKRAARTAAINLSAMHALEPLVAALNASDVPCMLLKGGALLLGAYARPQLRPMTDIDILVAPPDAHRALEVLTEQGCSPGPALVNTDFFPNYYYEREYFTPPPLRFRLDVHVRALRPQRFARLMPDDGLWREARCVERNNIRFTLPSTEAMLVHLAAHSAIHGNTRFIWLYDLMRVRHAARDFDDGSFTRLATQWGLTLPVRRGLTAAARLFNDHRLAGLSDALATPVGWRDRLALWQAPRDRATPLAHLAVDLLTTPGVGYRLGYMKAIMVPDDNHLGQIYRWRHPGWRPCALMWRGLRRPLANATRFLKRPEHIPA